MIYYYGVTQQGTYHIEHDLVCQDAHFCKVINDHFAIAAVADGLGSEKYSDVASKIASEKSVQYCSENINENGNLDDIPEVIKKSFEVALGEIYAVADAEKQERDQYDTTLSVVVFLNGTVYFGNSGDSGIVVLNKDGTYDPLTEQQRDENGYVFPLCFGEEKWVFGKKENVGSVLLATDGMLETLFPFLLKNEPVSIYVALAHFLMNEESLHFADSADGDVQQKMDAFVASISGKQVNDDKTILVMLDTAIICEKQSPEYYAAPDWASLKKKHDEAFRRAAYPHLYKDEENMAEEKNEEDTSVTNNGIENQVNEVTEVLDNENQPTVSSESEPEMNESNSVEEKNDAVENSSEPVEKENTNLFSKLKSKAGSIFKKNTEQ